MKLFIKRLSFVALFAFFALGAHSAMAYDPYPYQGGNSQPIYYPQNNYYGNDTSAYLAQLIAIVEQLQQQLAQQQGYPYQNGGYYPNDPYTYYPTTGNSGSNNYDRKPDVETDDADDVDEDSAELRGEVDMNDFDDGLVFFVYGQDEDRIEDVERDYDEYDEVKDDEDRDDFEVIRVDRGLDGDEEYEERVDDLQEDEEYFFTICVEYDDRDNDETLKCGNVEDFETDDEYNDDERPDVETLSADDVDEDSAELRGEVDMNDFDDGLVFFVYGQDEDDVDDVEDEESYADVDEHGDDLQKVRVDSDLDDYDEYQEEVRNLDDHTDYYFRICVEYDNEHNDETLECGNVREFQTD